jgi:hypothetical protein
MQKTTPAVCFFSFNWILLKKELIDSRPHLLNSLSSVIKAGAKALKPPFLYFSILLKMVLTAFLPCLSGNKPDL